MKQNRWKIKRIAGKQINGKSKIDLVVIHALDSPAVYNKFPSLLSAFTSLRVDFSMATEVIYLSGQKICRN